MEGGAQGRVRTGEEVGLEAEDLFSEDDDASSSEAEAEAEAKAAREVYDKGTPEYYGRHFKKFAKGKAGGGLMFGVRLILQTPSHPTPQGYRQETAREFVSNDRREGRGRGAGLGSLCVS